MTRDTVVILILSIQVTCMGFFISRLCYRLGYEEGRSRVYTDIAAMPDPGDVGECHQKGGCGDLPYTSLKKERKHK